MAETPHTPEERQRAWSAARVAGLGAVVVLAVLLLVVVFRGCAEGEVERDVLDPDSPLPGQEEIGNPTGVTLVSAEQLLPGYPPWQNGRAAL